MPSPEGSSGAVGTSGLGPGGRVRGPRREEKAPRGGLLLSSFLPLVTPHFSSDASVHLPHDAFEHALRARERIDLIEQLIGVALLDQRARFADYAARLVDRVAPEIAAGDDLLDLREQR